MGSAPTNNITLRSGLRAAILISTGVMSCYHYAASEPNPAECVRRCVSEAQATVESHSDNPKAGNVRQTMTVAERFATKYDEQTRLTICKFITARVANVDAAIPEPVSTGAFDGDGVFDAMLLACTQSGKQQNVTVLLESRAVRDYCNQPIEYFLQGYWSSENIAPLFPLFDAATSGDEGADAAFIALRRCCSQSVASEGIDRAEWLKRAAEWYQSSWRGLTLSDDYLMTVQVDPGRIPKVGLSRKD